MSAWDLAFRATVGLFLLLLVVSAVLMLVALVSYWRDRWLWNGGVCRQSGLSWNVLRCGDGRVKISCNNRSYYIGQWIGSEEYC